MRNNRWQFVVGALIILGVLTWLGVAGIRETQTYYLTIAELQAQERVPERLRVAGDVVPGSIRREQGRVHFRLQQTQNHLEVVYVGSEPLPDTFVDGAQAIVTGSLGRDHVFQAHQVQAKCASKYEAVPPGPAARTPDASN